jgi:hypothetical protein
VMLFPLMLFPLMLFPPATPKGPDGPAIVFPAAAWSTFVSAVKKAGLPGV